ncbi:tetratricopeptide repeat protein [Flavobacterium sp. LHD-80]|uniref:tetratricopeptide repeat-containing sensor histidine kinase n=1 Tax=Flavobacterium sp. LHD-80 TaxID=3071411 RepID=UPI0027E022D6|nr:tetratricopeptide repeat protein [Flavobacterium sp. LHD-80]MDQ6470879.1 tetratricopeptide repeat protein [Flavobacterium sp. LHD-80]
MLRSPFFCFLFFVFLLSCKDKTDVPVKNEALKKEAKELRGKGIKTLEKENYDSAFYYFNKSIILYKKTADSANIVYVLSQVANIQQINGDYYGSKETLTEALPYVRKKDIYSSYINNLFGIAEKELSNYKDAIYYYNETIKDYNKPGVKRYSLNNIAVIYINQKKYDKAINLLESAIKIKITKTELQYDTSRILDNLGYAYFKNGLPEKGLLYMNKSLELRKTYPDDYGSIENSLHLSEFYSETNPQKSKEFALKAYGTATKMHSIDERLESLALLMSNKSVAENTEYAKKFTFLNDSITKIRNNFKNKSAKIKYDSQKEKNENEKLRLEKAENQLALQRAQYRQFIFISIFLLLFLLIFYLRKYYRNKNRIEKLKTAYETEIRISKDIHDELANDVFHTIAFSQTQPLENENSKETLIQKLDHIYARVRSISKENNTIDTGIHYVTNLKEMLSTYNNETRNIIINSIEKINWEAIDDIKKITIQRLLQELMVNMSKHSEASLVVVKFDHDTNKIFIDYTDNGKGAKKNKIIKNGIQNMENRILSTKGTLTFDTEPNKGFKVKISMPK